MTRTAEASIESQPAEVEGFARVKRNSFKV
jgi:hypothetical protein